MYQVVEKVYLQLGHIYIELSILNDLIHSTYFLDIIGGIVLKFTAFKRSKLKANHFSGWLLVRQ